MFAKLSIPLLALVATLGLASEPPGTPPGRLGGAEHGGHGYHGSQSGGGDGGASHGGGGSHGAGGGGGHR